jgi:hypothetical protein
MASPFARVTVYRKFINPGIPASNCDNPQNPFSCFCPTRFVDVGAIYPHRSRQYINSLDEDHSRVQHCVPKRRYSSSPSHLQVLKQCLFLAEQVGKFYRENLK